jgi:nitrate/nitrite transporter NarK
MYSAQYSLWGLVVRVPTAIITDFHIGKAQAAQFVMFSWGVGTFGYLAAGRLADRFGRKVVLSAYTILGLIAVLDLNYMLTRSNITLAQLLLPGTLIGVSLGVSAIYITYTSEIYPSRLRTMGLGFSVALGKVTALFVPAGGGAGRRGCRHAAEEKQRMAGRSQRRLCP